MLCYSCSSSFVDARFSEHRPHLRNGVCSMWLTRGKHRAGVWTRTHARTASQQCLMWLTRGKHRGGVWRRTRSDNNAQCDSPEGGTEEACGEERVRTAEESFVDCAVQHLRRGQHQTSPPLLPPLSARAVCCRLYDRRLSAGVTSSAKPEVHNVPQRRQPRL